MINVDKFNALPPSSTRDASIRFRLNTKVFNVLFHHYSDMQFNVVIFHHYMQRCASSALKMTCMLTSTTTLTGSMHYQVPHVMPRSGFDWTQNLNLSCSIPLLAGTTTHLLPSRVWSCYYNSQASITHTDTCKQCTLFTFCVCVWSTGAKKPFLL
jgi:hypothetical protein